MVRSVGLFAAWALVGFVASFALLYGFTPIGPAIVLSTWVGYRYLPRISGHRIPEAFGALAGFGAFWLFLATTVDGDASVVAATGAAAVGAAIGAYLVAGRRRCKDGLRAA